MTEQRRVYTNEEAAELIERDRWVAGLLKHEFDEETIEEGEASARESIYRIITGQSTEDEEYKRMLAEAHAMIPK